MTGARVHITTREPITRPGGLHSYVRTLAAGQSKIGLAPEIFDEIKSTGLHAERKTRFEGLCAEPSSVIEFHFAHGALPVLKAHRPSLRGTQKVMHFHGPWAAEGRVQGDSLIRSVLKLLYERRTYHQFTHLVTASNAFASVLTGSYGIPSSLVDTLHPGIDVAAFDSALTTLEARRHLGLDESRPTFLCVRRLEPRMGIDLAIEAIKSLPDAQLVVVGDGSLRQQLEQAAKSELPDSSVRFLGRVPDEDLAHAYRAADISLVPSRSLEGFGMVVLESMAAGTPVIATRVGGLLEALGPFSEELTFDGSSADLVRALTRVGNDQGLKERVRAYAETQSEEAMAQTMEDLLTAHQS